MCVSEYRAATPRFIGYRRAVKRLVSLALLACVGLANSAAADVVVVEVRKGGEAAKAKLKPGDRLVGWRRAVTKTSPAASGAFRAPWEVDEAEFSETPRGAVTVVWGPEGRVRR